MTISVVVPVRDGADVLGACLDALAGQRGTDTTDVIEVIVVDNGSRDMTARLARDHPLAPRVVTEDRPGSYAARNRGVAASTGRIVAFTDADCIPDPGWLGALVHALDRGSAAAGGPIVPIASDAPTLWERWDGAAYLDQKTYVEQGFGATASFACTRAAWEHVGPFDPALRSSGDLEWGLRARSAGVRVVYAEDAIVRHRPRTTMRATWKLHRRLAAGWRVMLDRGLRDRAWCRRQLTLPLGQVAEQIARHGPRVRRRKLVRVHAVVLLARWVGWVTRR